MAPFRTEDKMTRLFGDEAQSIINSAVERLNHEKAQPITGKATDLRCSCGGVLHERDLGPSPLIRKPPRVSRNRRIARKQMKRWFEETRPMRLLHIMISAARSTGFRCASCRRHMGFYDAIARNVFKVEPMPQGALPCYERDVDVASIVAPESEEPV